ncbi:MAG: ROK family protein [Eubacteriales bacterium]
MELFMRIITLNAAEMKSFNRRRILEHLRTQSTSRAELSRMTGLTRSAISLIVDGLLGDDILREGCEQGGRVGRKSVSLVINPLAFHSIGLTISRGQYAVGLVDFGGTIQKRISKPLDPHMSVPDTLELIAKEAEMILRTNPLPGRLLGMGITAPGPLDVKRGMILHSPHFEKWSDVSIVDFFSRRIPGTILLENKANAMALAEKTFCMKGKYDSFLELVIDAGVGAGLIIEGDLYKGGTGFGNEFGHTSINMNGPRCDCGNFGCAQLYASIPNLLIEACKQDPLLDSWEQIADLSLAGNAAACSILEMEAEYLASIIVNAVNILDIEAVVLTGVIAYHPDELNDKITRKVNDRFIARGTRQIKILASRMAKYPDTLSSANLVMEHYVRLGE